MTTQLRKDRLAARGIIVEDIGSNPTDFEAIAPAPRIEVLALSIATNQFTVPLPTGKEIVRAVNSHQALIDSAQMVVDWYEGRIKNLPADRTAMYDAARAALKLTTKEQ